MRAALFLCCVACGGPAARQRAPVSSIAEPSRGRDDEEVLVPAGTFTRGRDGAARPDERPAHVVQMRAFYIDRTLVTRRAFLAFAERTGYVTTAERVGHGVGAYEGMGDWEWERIVGASFRAPLPAEKPNAAAFLHDDAPVVTVSWFDAIAFCSDAKKRLPTEAEWEYAMRAGRAGTRYPWGNDPRRDGRLALNFWQGDSHQVNAREDGFVYVSPVRAFAPNAFGLFDAVGNVWQWVHDGYAEDAYARAAGAGAAANPVGPEHAEKRVLRGGSWWCGPSTCEGYGLFYRGKAVPYAAFNNNGFRCARDA